MNAKNFILWSSCSALWWWLWLLPSLCNDEIKPLKPQSVCAHFNKGVIYTVSFDIKEVLKLLKSAPARLGTYNSSQKFYEHSYLISFCLLWIVSLCWIPYVARLWVFLCSRSLTKECATWAYSPDLPYPRKFLCQNLNRWDLDPY